MTAVAEKVLPGARDKKGKCKNKPLRDSPKSTPLIVDAPEESDTKTDGEALVCCDCASIITFASEKIEINGAYNHSFANPHGLFFEIGCYKNAPGCAYSNESSNEFTWFRGFSWRVAVCRSCANHIGWLFSSTQSRFHGLISDKLTPARIEKE